MTVTIKFTGNQLVTTVNSTMFTISSFHEYSAKIQLLILFFLLLGSYAHRGARLTIGFFASTYLAFKVAVPIFRLAMWLFQYLWWIFKAIAMFGFYVHYFQYALGFIVATIGFILSGSR